MATRVVKKLSPAELERNQAVLLNTGLAIGQHKGVYQMSSKDGKDKKFSFQFNLTFLSLMFLREQAAGSGV